MKTIYSILLTCIISGCSLVQQEKINYPNNFTNAKKIARQIFSDSRESFYCGCKYDKQLNVNWNSCGYKPRKNSKRAAKIEWEHTVAAENFGKSMPSQCWTQPICTKKDGTKYKGRHCCLKIDKDFKKMHSDLHNLVPAIGQINADRSNYRFSPLPDTSSMYGQCTMKIDFKQRKAEPTDKTKGTVARAYLYFNQQYNLKISKAQLSLFKVWDKQYPPGEWEINWNNKVAEYQGNVNTFITKWNSNLN